MDPFIALGMAVVTFLLGLVASAFGAKVGRALEARMECLIELRNLVDPVLEHANHLYQVVYGRPDIWSDDESRELIRHRLVNSARILGLAQALGSQDLFFAVQDFAMVSKRFEDLAVTTLNTRHEENRENDEQEGATTRRELLSVLLSRLNDSAQNLHAMITSESIRGVPGLILRRQKLPRVRVDFSDQDESD